MRLLDLGSVPWSVSGYWHNGARLRPGSPPLVGPVPARVPGAIQDDLLRAGILADLNLGFASREAEWVEHRDWVYSATFRVPAARGERQWLRWEGLDWSGEIHLNGRSLGRFAGMFLPVEQDVSALLRPEGEDNQLVVAFDPPPEVEGQIGHSSRIRTLKSRFNYQWDWCPRIVPVGIWDEARIECSGAVRLEQPFVATSWDSLSATGSLRCQVSLEGEGAQEARVRVSVLPDGGGAAVWEGELGAASGAEAGFPPEAPGLVHRRGSQRGLAVEPWWPTGFGPRPLYRVRLEVFAADGRLSDERTLRTGFRELHFGPNPGAPEGALPYTCLCNGKRVYLQGVNWVPPTPLYGALRREDYEPVLARLRNMGCTMLRVWGGAVLEKEAFYELCDEMGLLVWQEFYQSSSGLDNLPSEDPEVIADLATVSTAALQRRRHHPCLAAWCGGNELTWLDGRPAGLDHPNLARLAQVVEEHDPGRMFFPSSPSGPSFGASPEQAGKGLHHDVHGPWTYVGHPQHYRHWDGVDALLHSEAGAPGASRAEIIRRVAGTLPAWPPSRQNPLWVHHGDWWVQWDELTALFGPWSGEAELEAYLASSRYLQAEALRYAAEAVRRREPLAAGFLIWAGPEPWANTANCSVLEYDGEPKPAYGFLRGAFAPLHLSCRYPALAWKPGETWSAEAFWHRGVTAPTTAGWSARGRLVALDGTELGLWHWPLAAQGEPVTALGGMRWAVRDVPHGVFLLRLEAGPEGWDPEVVHTYAFTVPGAAAPLEPLRRLPPPRLQARRLAAGLLEVENRGEVAAVAMHLACPSWDVDPNDFTLLPGERRVVHLTPLVAETPEPRIAWEAMGLAASDVGVWGQSPA